LSAQRVAAVIGSPIGHSRSPQIFARAFAEVGLPWDYVRFDVPTGSGAAAIESLRTLRLVGLSVTMPLKEEVAAAVDRLTPSAQALGAVNCVAWEEDTVVGHNTDGAGFVDSLAHEGVSLDGSRIVVLGAGGAARAIVDALGRTSAAEIVVVNRTHESAVLAAALAPSIARVDSANTISDADIVVNTTPVGMDGTPFAGHTPFDVSLLSNATTVVDIVYNPLETPLLQAAALHGCRTIDGLGMLTHQAANQFRLWTGLEPPIDVMLDAVRNG
jgi:shikimate dehydrogenase